MRGKKVKSLTWRRWLMVVSGILILAFILTYRLESLPGQGMSLAEAQAAQHSQSWRSVLQNPLFLPVSALQHVTNLATPFSLITSQRLASVMIALLTFGLIAYVLLKWYGPRTAFFGCLAVATSAWFLHVARSGSVDIAYYAALPLLIAAHVFLDRAEKPGHALPVWITAMGALLYIPGLIWFILINAFWQRRELADGFKELSKTWQRIGIFLLGIVLVTPLTVGLFYNPILHYLVVWMGFPGYWPAISVALQSIGRSLLFIFFWTPAKPSLWLGHLPLLDVFLSAMLIAGIYFYGLHRGANRSKLLLVFFGLGVLLIATKGLVTRSLLVPIIYLVAAGGIAYILHQWLRVFPRNPLARTLGVGMVLVALTISCAYNLRQYFVAWPHHPDTAKAFVDRGSIRETTDDNLLYWEKSQEER